MLTSLKQFKIASNSYWIDNSVKHSLDEIPEKVNRIHMTCSEYSGMLLTSHESNSQGQ